MDINTLVNRRRVLAAGGVVAAAGVLTACSSGGDGMTGEPVESPTANGQDSGGVAAAGALVAVADVPLGGGVVIADPPIVVVQPTEGAILGYTAICPHQGCLVSEVVDNEILCPCHGSLFSAQDGSVIAGPAQQGLASADVQIDGDSVVLG
ncbi:MAG: hypothetical protein RJB01_256 [Actinomycetota bacterium]|jgi:Rieske Fe-S protein